MERFKTIALLLVARLPALCLEAQSTDHSVQLRDWIIIAKGDKHFTSFEFINEKGEPDGFSVKLSRALMKRLNIHYTFSLED